MRYLLAPYVSPDQEPNWKEVTLEEFQAAERRAGFRNKGGGPTATAAFIGGGLLGCTLHEDAPFPGESGDDKLSDYVSYELGNIEAVPPEVEARIVSGLVALEQQVEDLDGELHACKAAFQLLQELEAINEALEQRVRELENKHLGAVVYMGNNGYGRRPYRLSLVHQTHDFAEIAREEGFTLIEKMPIDVNKAVVVWPEEKAARKEA